MNALVNQQFGAVSTKFAGIPVDNELAAGIEGSYGIMGFKGKVWSIRYRGDEKKLMRPDNDGPQNSIEVVIVASASVKSKIFYEGGYKDGAKERPDCFSNNGVTPDPGATKKQSATCAACPRNVFGSRITESGKPGKECSDSKRVAIVPLGDLENEAFGGPMLLRIPAASLQDLAAYAMKMQSFGYPYFAIGTRISFDTNEAYPKFVFKEVRALNDSEADIVLRMRKDPGVARIIAESEFAAPAQAQVAGPAFEQPVTRQVAAPAPAPVQPAPAPKPATVSGFGGVVDAAPKPAAPVQVTPQVAPAGQAPSPEAISAFEAELDAKMDALLPS